MNFLAVFQEDELQTFLEKLGILAEEPEEDWITSQLMNTSSKKRGRYFSFILFEHLQGNINLTGRCVQLRMILKGHNCVYPIA